MHLANTARDNLESGRLAHLRLQKLLAVSAIIAHCAEYILWEVKHMYIIRFLV